MYTLFIFTWIINIKIIFYYHLHCRFKVSLLDSRKMFQQNDQFCAICGSILPLPERVPSTVQCALCKAKWPIQSHSRSFCRHERNFEKIESGTGDVQLEEDVTVEHTCPKCDFNEATYTTQQTRSADEGQTIFYQCVRCKHRSIEYS